MDVSKCVSLVLFVVIVVLVLQTECFDKALERMKLEGHYDHDIDIYIERRINFLHSRIDLRPTQDGLLLLEKCTLRLEQGSTTPLSRVLSSHVSKRLDRLANKLARVTGHEPSRQKRSIEFIGNLWSDLFGNPGPNDWKQINSNVLALKSAIQKLDENTGIDHKDIDSNRHAIEKQSSEIREIISVVNKNRAELTKADEDLTFMKNFFEIMTLTEAVESQIDYLIEVKIDSMKGFCNDRALNKNFLVDNLLTLEANKMGLGPVFGSWEWREYYRNRMCTIALNGNDLWVTLRIPQVKKAEKLVRVIPLPNINEVIRKIVNYGIVVTIFKEKDNEKYLAITQTSLDLCNVLGNTRTCGVRDSRFVANTDIVMPVEFALNRFLIVGSEPKVVKVMSKCPSGITEHSIAVDSVWLAPNNCSFSSPFLSIDVREADVEITKEIGIVHFDKFEVSLVKGNDLNKPLIVKEALNNTVSKVFETNRLDIKNKLDQVHTNHTNFLSQYSFEKWILISLLAVVSLLVALFKSYFAIKKCKSPRRSELDLERSNQKISFLQLQQSEQRHEHDTQQQLQTQQQHQQHDDNARIHDDKKAGQNRENKTFSSNVYSEIAEEVGKVSFSSKPEQSQFFK